MKTIEGETLTVEQQKLVDENLGLVGFELARFGRLRPPTRHRESEDLFQEGCLGLIRAARSFQTQRGIPFAAWALPRIHSAMRRALGRSFSTLRAPMPRRRCDRRKLRNPFRAPEAVPLTFDPQTKAASNPPGESDETIGQRLGDKYERALARATARMCHVGCSRDDRAALCELLVRERVAVPEPSAQTPLREIARRTQSSYARVRQCEDQLKAEIRHALGADPEVAVLFAELRRHERGVAGRLDAEVEQRLLAAAEQRLGDCLTDLPREARADLLLRLVELGGGDATALGAQLLPRLAPEQRERLFIDLDAPPPKAARRRKRRRRTHRP
jgi:RNA polymerase sigma factor (sigma-70 family)